MNSPLIPAILQLVAAVVTVCALSFGVGWHMGFEERDRIRRRYAQPTALRGRETT